MRTRAFRIGLLTGFVVLFAAQGTVAQERHETQPGEAAAEGIAVHGHWTIEIIREGQIAKKLEFENELADDGALVNMLSGGGATSGEYNIIIVDDSSLNLKCANSSFTGSCLITVQSEGVISTSEGNFVLLEGSFSITLDGTIHRVQTSIETCDSATSPDNCSGGASNFTRTVLPSPESVQSGDTVNVRVEITFS